MPQSFLSRLKRVVWVTARTGAFFIFARPVQECRAGRSVVGVSQGEKGHRGSYFCVTHIRRIFWNMVQRYIVFFITPNFSGFPIQKKHTHPFSVQ